jgi:hypothetical protein
MHRSVRRRGHALMATAVLLGAVAGTSLGLLEGGGPGPTAAAPARAATAVPSTSRAGPAPHAASTSRSNGGPPAEQRLGAPRRQLDRGGKGGKFEQKEPGDSGKLSHGKGSHGKGKGKGKQAHDR